MTPLMSLSVAAELIRTGQPLLIAGSEALLRKLPAGNWIGGTTPYFMAPGGALESSTELLVTTLPATVRVSSTRLYGPDALSKIPRDYPENGLSFVILPAGSESHHTFARDSSTWPAVFDRPLVGWVSGYDLASAPRKPLVVDGRTLDFRVDAAAVMHLDLADGLVARTDIINLFEPDETDTVEFETAGFIVTTCRVNGERRGLAEWLTSVKHDTRLPLVADFTGANLNVSIQAIADDGAVQLYAPVFEGITYRRARPLRGDYATLFVEEMKRRQAAPLFTCNCVLNYLYADLKGRPLGNTVGPITFGEVAWMLLNQTMVYVTIEPVGR